MRVFSEVVRKGDFDLAEVVNGGGEDAGREGDERVLDVVKGLSPVLLGVLGNEVSFPPFFLLLLLFDGKSFPLCLSLLFLFCLFCDHCPPYSLQG